MHSYNTPSLLLIAFLVPHCPVTDIGMGYAASCFSIPIYSISDHLEDTQGSLIIKTLIARLQCMLICRLYTFPDYHENRNN